MAINQAPKTEFPEEGFDVHLQQEGGDVNIQNPLPTDGDSVYVKDLNILESDQGGFSLNVDNYFNDLTSVSVNSDTGENPKEILIWFNRTLYSSAVGLGCNDLTKGFGASITLELLGSGKVVRRIINHIASDPNSTLIPFTPAAFNGMVLKFNTTSEVALSNITIRKESQVAAQIQGINPSGQLVTVNTNTLGNLLVSLDEQKDAFGRLKTADPATIFDNSLTNPESDILFWSSLITGTASGVYDRATSKYTLQVAVNGDSYIRQTKTRFKYQPAKSHEWFITGVLSTETDVRKRLGLVDYDNVGLGVISNTPQNGVFIENNGGVLSWNIVNNGVITETVLQAGWNIDKADGTGRSGFIFNPDAVNIFTCQLEWLGVGVVLVGFATGAGSVVYVHAFQHASVNGFVDVYMRTANLPVAYSIESLGGVGSMRQICSSVISGGGFNPQGITFAVQNTSDVAVSSGVEELLIGIRLKEDSFEFTVDPTFVSILSLSNGNSLWALCINPTYTGAVTWVDEPNTEIQVAQNNDNVVTNRGIVIAAGSFSNNSDNLNEEIRTALRIGKDLQGNLDELWLVVTALGNESYRGTINGRQFI